MTMPETSAESIGARETRTIWIAIALALVVWIVTIVAFGYPALIIGALALTALVYVVLLLLMRGK